MDWPVLPYFRSFGMTTATMPEIWKEQSPFREGLPEPLSTGPHQVSYQVFAVWVRNTEKDSCGSLSGHEYEAQLRYRHSTQGLQVAESRYG